MTTPRLAAIKVAVIYWALLTFGMALYTVIRIDDFATLSPVWSGTIVGTALGQFLAARRHRAWLVIVAIVVVGVLWIPQLPDDVSRHSVWLAYLPAAACGFWSLGDRTSLVAFWFPAVIWMLSILDGTDANAVPDATGLVLLGALAVMFVAYLRVREERRVALWRTVATAPLAVVKPQVLLQETARAPRIVWTVVVSALGFAATMWLAPKLWHPETFDGGPVAVHAASTQIGLPCCPRMATAPTTRGRMREYFDLGRSHEQVGAPQQETGCRVCTADVALGDPIVTSGGGGGGGDFSGATPAIYDPPTSLHPTAHTTYMPEPSPVLVPTPAPPSATPPPLAVTPSAAVIAPVAPPPPVAPVAVDAPSIAPVQQTAAISAKPTTTAALPVVSAGTPPVIRAPSSAGSIVLRWAAILTAALLMSQLFALALRPLRRGIALRHFEHPFWDETVDQRVSNAWQLALVGLYDAGYRATITESPTAFAKRVNIAGLDRCATILERARHGIGIDRDDLAEMTTSAATVYRAARARASRTTRSLSWMRWPLA